MAGAAPRAGTAGVRAAASSGPAAVTSGARAVTSDATEILAAGLRPEADRPAAPPVPARATHAPRRAVAAVPASAAAAAGTSIPARAAASAVQVAAEAAARQAAVARRPQRRDNANSRRGFAGVCCSSTADARRQIRLAWSLSLGLLKARTRGARSEIRLCTPRRERNAGRRFAGRTHWRVILVNWPPLPPPR